MQALSHIRQIDYTVIFARDMEAMRHFYENVMEFPLLRTLSDRWIEYRIGSTTLALQPEVGVSMTRRSNEARYCSWRSESHRRRWRPVPRHLKSKASS
jgi:hypothetical protein